MPLPVAVPYDMALLAHPPGVGTRMIFSIAGKRGWGGRVYSELMSDEAVVERLHE